MIHYHGTPFSGELKNTTALAGHHAMVSFARPDSIEIVAEICQSFALDNGAFSAWKKGTELDLEGFLEWAELWLRHPACDFALIPDVIDGDEDNNDMLIEIVMSWTASRPLHQASWVPVWHLHESLERLHKLAMAFPMVALGSSGEYAEPGAPDWWMRMSEAMVAVCDEDGYPITKLHGLRMLDPGIFSYIPFHSADSTNVARNMGIDIRWTGPYVPTTVLTRALVIMDRIEAHAAAARWNGHHWHQQNMDLLG